MAYTRTDSTPAADWRNIDPSSLPSDLAAAYETYKTAQRTASAAREAFESAFSSAVPSPAGQRLAFGYRFGKLSIAVVPDDRPTMKASTKTLSMADLATMMGRGR